MPSQVKTITAEQQSASLYQRVTAASVGGLLGVFLLIGVGFASPDLLHNAAHDSRHANTFPCH